GDGGDELFGGYERYVADNYLRHLASLPGGIRRGVLGPAFAAAEAVSLPGRLKRRLGQLAALAPMSDAERHLNWLSFFTPAEKSNLFTREFKSGGTSADSAEIMEKHYASVEDRQFTERQLTVDFLTYLPETLMMKVDRASMAVGLEVRCPILSKSMIELAFSIPGEMKIKQNTTKWVLKEAFADLLPYEVLHRRKKGFEAPLNDWFRGRLKDVSRDLLTDATAAGRGVFDQAEVRKILDEHQSGANHGHKIWTLLATELWFRTFIDGPAPAAPLSLI
ncbi:MAG TPA: asparagine synthase-related protein, partial [bacterium]|nr:asparagine synthase-related protein [bacterium]